MKLKIGEKELSVKFGYKPTLKGRIISRMVKVADLEGEDGETDIGKVEDLLLFLPEVLLAGLQVYHKDEYGYDYETGFGKEEKLEKVFDLMEQYCSDEGGDVIKLFERLQEAMLQDGFLKSLFQKEQEKLEREEARANPTAAEMEKSEN